ncbi:hypothetical protein Skr01_19390 [Sphaerisporangium krabiense]|nr:hypothetical protein Skr01_19390 [Sphaerisporangium krabiense]
MVHIGPELVANVLGEAAGRRVGLPLFTEPVMAVPGMARRLRLLHQALVGGDVSALRRDELLDGVVAGMARRARVQRCRVEDGFRGEADAGAARVVRELVHYSQEQDVSAGDLAAAVGRSRFAVYRSFRAAYGMAPSDYQRQVRLREARRLLVQGRPLAEVAVETGFTDQSHLTRWFTRYFGVTPGVYRRAAASP